MNKLQRLGFFRRSIVLNFLAILLIIGVVLALHAANKKFFFSKTPAVTQAQPEDMNAANTAEPEIVELKPAPDPAPTLAPAPEAEKPAAIEEKPAPKRRVAAVGKSRATRTRQSRWSEDHSYGVENLDGESARRRYLESNKDSSGSYSTYTMTESPPEPVSRTYAYDDLDGAAARAQYRKETERLSKANLK